MQYAICLLTLIPVRAEPKHQSEQVTQLLFGECMNVLQVQEGWLYVQIRHDGYKGWVETKQVQELEKADADRLSKTNSFCADLLSYAQFADGSRQPILLGSPLIDWAGIEYHGQVFWFKPLTEYARVDTLLETAQLLLGAPYQWGGRSPMGVDCSGLMQLLFRMIQVKLPRDAYQQAEEGKLVPIDEMQVGDLAFFKGTNGKIGHVGLVWDTDKILHASGAVRIDALHRKGIFDGQNYTHTLAWIRRFL